MANSKKCEMCDVHFDGHTKSVMYQDEDGEVAFQRELDAKTLVKQTPWQKGGDTAASVPRRRNLEDKKETARLRLKMRFHPFVKRMNQSTKLSKQL